MFMLTPFYYLFKVLPSTTTDCSCKESLFNEKADFSLWGNGFSFYKKSGEVSVGVKEGKYLVYHIKNHFQQKVLIGVKSRLKSACLEFCFV